MKSLRLFILFSIIILSGFANRAWTVSDSWYNAPKEAGLTSWDWKEVNFSGVKESSQKEAQQLLETAQIYEISEERMMNFAVKPLQVDGNVKFFLIRAVYLNEGTGEFSVHSRGSQLWVYHGSLGHEPVPMKRKALIIAVENEPAEIFITCMMDE